MSRCCDVGRTSQITSRKQSCQLVWKGLIDTSMTYAILTKITYYGDILFYFLFFAKSNYLGTKQQQAAPDK